MQEHKAVAEVNNRLQKENEGLRQWISKLRNDNFYLEKMAREELNLVRPGEMVDIEVELTDRVAMAYFLTGTASVGGELATRLDFACAATKPPDG